MNRSLRRFLLIGLSLAALALGLIWLSTPTPIASPLLSDEAASLLAYEVQNRAYARLTLQSTANCRAKEPDAGFWAAYQSLETLNLARYQQALHALGASTQAKAFTRLRAWLSRPLFCHFTRQAVPLIRDATVRYTRKLETLPLTAAPETVEFLRYLVAQEQAQEQALTQLAAGEISEGTNTLVKFAQVHAMQPVH